LQTFYAAKHRDEPQALTKGLSKERTRARVTSQWPQTGLLNHSFRHKIVNVWTTYLPSFGILFFFVPGGGAQSGRLSMMK
jgi:hypothetical protein